MWASTNLPGGERAASDPQRSGHIGQPPVKNRRNVRLGSRQGASAPPTTCCKFLHLDRPTPLCQTPQARPTLPLEISHDHTPSGRAPPHPEIDRPCRNCSGGSLSPKPRAANCGAREANGRRSRQRGVHPYDLRSQLRFGCGGELERPAALDRVRLRSRTSGTDSGDRCRRKYSRTDFSDQSRSGWRQFQRELGAVEVHAPTTNIVTNPPSVDFIGGWTLAI